jgi:hypothetical protein
MIYHPSNCMMNIIAAILNNTPSTGYHILTVLLSSILFLESLDRSCHHISRTGQHKISLQNSSIFMSCKMPEFFENLHLSEAGKHPDFQVTSCLQNVTTEVKFDD